MSKRSKFYVIFVSILYFGGIIAIGVNLFLDVRNRVVLLIFIPFLIGMLGLGICIFHKYWRSTIESIRVCGEEVSFTTIDQRVHTYQKSDVLYVKRTRAWSEDYTFCLSKNKKLYTDKFLIYTEVHVGAADCSDMADLEFFENHVCAKR